MKRLLAALAALLVAAMPVKAAKAADPFLTLDTPGPYHALEVIVVTAHGNVPKDKGQRPGSWIVLACDQSGSRVWTEYIDSPVPDMPYEFHLGLGRPGDLWDLTRPADCSVRLASLGNAGHPGEVFTRIFFHVEA